MHVTVYSVHPAHCVACRFTQRDLEKHGIEYTKVRVDEDDNLRNELRERFDYRAFPIVEVDFGENATWDWAGYRPSMIERLTKEIL